MLVSSRASLRSLIPQRHQSLQTTRNHVVSGNRTVKSRTFRAYLDTDVKEQGVLSRNLRFLNTATWQHRSFSTAAATQEASETRSSRTESGEERVEVLEKGLVYFFYRPKVGVDEPKSLDDVFKLYIVLRPKGSKQARSLVIANKKLPSIESKSRYWGFVDKVSNDINQLKEYLGEETYQTKTRGERKLAAARPAGEGYYSVILHGDHTHLVYLLEQPNKLGPVQDAFNIKREGSYVISVMNPSRESIKTDIGFHFRKDVQSKMEWPAQFKEKFQSNKRYLPVDPSSLLDYERIEFGIIGSHEDPIAEFGSTGQDLKTEFSSGKTLDGNKLFQELKMEKQSLEPLTQGTWK